MLNSPQESELADCGVPDVLRPAQPLINPLDLVGRALRGFCSPPESSQQTLPKRNLYSEINSSSHCLSPHQQQQQPGTIDKKHFVDNFHHDACNSTITTMSDDWDDRDSTKGLDASYHCGVDEASNNAESEDVLVVETVPGTHRVVRVVRALEIFLCTVALLICTVVAAQRFGVQLEWYTKVDVADATLASLMKQKSVLEAILEVPVDNEACANDDVNIITEMSARDVSADAHHSLYDTATI